MKDNLILEAELKVIQTKLSYLREEWRKGSPAMRRYIHSSAVIWKEREEKLKRKIGI